MCCLHSAMRTPSDRKMGWGQGNCKFAPCAHQYIKQIDGASRCYFVTHQLTARTHSKSNLQTVDPHWPKIDTNVKRNGFQNAMIRHCLRIGSYTQLQSVTGCLASGRKCLWTALTGCACPQRVVCSKWTTRGHSFGK